MCRVDNRRRYQWIGGRELGRRAYGMRAVWTARSDEDEDVHRLCEAISPASRSWSRQGDEGLVERGRLGSLGKGEIVDCVARALAQRQSGTVRQLRAVAAQELDPVDTGDREVMCKLVEPLLEIGRDGGAMKHESKRLSGVTERTSQSLEKHRRVVALVHVPIVPRFASRGGRQHSLRA